MSVKVKGGSRAARAGGRAAQFGRRAAQLGRQAARGATNVGKRAGERGAHFAGRAAHHAARAARPGINAGRKTGQNAFQGARNAANTARRLATQGPSGMAKPAANAANRMLGRGNNPNAKQKESPAAEARRKKVNDIARKAGTALGPYGKIAIEAGILLKDNKKLRDILLYGSIALFFLIIELLAGGGPSKQQKEQQQQNPLQVTIECDPPQIPVGKTSVCTITVTDSQSTDDINLVATIYPFAQYVNNSAKYLSGLTMKQGGIYNATQKTVTWDTKNLKVSLSGAPVTETFMLTVTKTQKIQAVPIVAVASATGGGVAGTGCGSFNKTATDFNTLMSGQGRCTNVLGDENAFITAVTKNSGGQFNFAGRQSELQAIYQKAVSEKVNPLILVTIWGVESSFGTVDGENFNCGDFHSAFNVSLTCAVDTLNHYMTYFEQQKTKPVAISAGCTYNDPFIYAYEWYTPVCHTSDGNGPSRNNFVLYYKKLFGI
jgi:hypothetical protein